MTQISSRRFGRLSSGESVREYTLTNSAGITAKILDYGGIVTELHVPDRNGNSADIVLGFEDLKSYERDSFYLGAVIGRYAGRIRNGRLEINGTAVALARNNGANHLHGGTRGFNKVVWNATISDDPVQLVLRHQSPDGDEGYPGMLQLTVTYTLTTDNKLRVDYHATTDSPTVINLTQHTYFNLAGHASGDTLAHTLQVHAEHILELDDSLIPTGRPLSVARTPFDFLSPKTIGCDINADHQQLAIANGYDHTWVFQAQRNGREPVIGLGDEQSGRYMEIHTTEPGVQVYTGNFLDGSVTGKTNAVYRQHAGICLETQHFPDSPNQAAFPSTLLEPDKEFRSTTVFGFSAR